jgi:excisionase family DNA binding protein
VTSEEPDGGVSRARLHMRSEDAADPTHSVSLSEPLLTADDVPALLAVPGSSVYEYARRLHDPLPSIPVGRHRRFHRSAIEAWLARLA